jgi:DNA-3-methyladenine glycosylase
VTLAKVLLGQRLVRVLDDGTRLAGTIVETEAYLGVEDAAAHAFGGRRTARNEAMYARPGTAYVYFTYGMHYCMNVVCGTEEEPVAVLLRALEPTEGLDRMREFRLAGRKGRAKDAAGDAREVGTAPVGADSHPVRPTLTVPDRELCSGPARLCQALAINREHNLIDLTTDRRLWIEVLRARPECPPVQVLGNTARIGVGYAGAWAVKPLRWFLRSSVHVSRSTRC